MFHPFSTAFPDDPDPFSAHETDSSFSLDLDFPDPFGDPQPRPFSAQSSPIERRPARPAPRAAHSGPSAFTGRRPLFPPALLFIGKLDLGAMAVFQPRSRHPPRDAATAPSPLGQVFDDAAVALNPPILGFIPVHFWPNKEVRFLDLVYDFFQRKNNVNARFLHKLYNALRISTIAPAWAEIVGVRWESPVVIRVNKEQFAQLLGIKAINGSLFHKQGNFTTHGFVELNKEQAQTCCPNVDIEGIDFDNVRLLVHQPGMFVSDCGELHRMAMQAQMGRK
jgi:hypothetical protein